MSDLHKLLTDGLRPGVFRWRSDETPDQVRREVVGAGWDFVLLDTTEVHDKAGFLDLCATAFDLPRWFGRNWDALADSLSDRSTGDREIVLWAGLHSLLDHDHDTVDVALQIFTEDIANSGQLRVLVLEPPTAKTPALLSTIPVP
jgi:RNAse (barnase) inhibitor barstar